MGNSHETYGKSYGKILWEHHLSLGNPMVNPMVNLWEILWEMRKSTFCDWKIHHPGAGHTMAFCVAFSESQISLALVAPKEWITKWWLSGWYFGEPNRSRVAAMRLTSGTQKKTIGSPNEDHSLGIFAGYLHGFHLSHLSPPAVRSRKSWWNSPGVASPVALVSRPPFRPNQWHSGIGHICGGQWPAGPADVGSRPDSPSNWRAWDLDDRSLQSVDTCERLPMNCLKQRGNH